MADLGFAYSNNRQWATEREVIARRKVLELCVRFPVYGA